MSFKEWWRALLKKEFFFSKTCDWPGEKGLPAPETEPDVSKETINDEIRRSLKKEE